MLSDIMIGDLYVHKIHGIVEVVDADHNGNVKCLIVGTARCVDIQIKDFMIMKPVPKKPASLRLMRSLLILGATVFAFGSVAIIAMIIESNILGSL